MTYGEYFRIPYSSFVGGVLAMNETVFQLVNGFSNLYLGWGGEDDDMSVRYSNTFPDVLMSSILFQTKQNLNQNICSKDYIKMVFIVILS